MSAEAVQTEIIEPMQRLFLPPRQMGKDEQMAALRDYVAALQGFEMKDLHEAWVRVRDSHANRSWPVPSVFVVAARGARKDRMGDKADAPRRVPNGEKGTWQDWLAAARTPVAKEACRLQVAWSFKCAVLHDGKRVHEIDLQRLVYAKASAERLAEKIRLGQVVEHKGRQMTFSEENANLALKMWRTILQRETETQNEIRRAA